MSASGAGTPEDQRQRRGVNERHRPSSAVTDKVIVGDAKTYQQRTLLFHDGTIEVLRVHRTMLEHPPTSAVSSL